VCERKEERERGERELERKEVRECEREKEKTRE